MGVRAASGTGHLTKASALTGAPYTRIAWHRTADVTAAYTNLGSIYNTAGDQYDYISVSSTVDTALQVGTQASNMDSAAGAVAADTWFPVVTTRTGNTRVVWAVNTRISATDSNAAAGGYDNLDLLGYSSMPSEVDRDVAGFKAWNALLTDAEIALEVQQFAPVRTANLAHYSPLHDHTDLADDVAGGSWTNNGATLSTVTGPDIPEEWTGPTIASINTTAATSSSGGLSINMPSGIAAGDLLLAFASNDTSVSWSSGWTTIDNGANGTAVQGACFAKIAAGGDTLTITGEANDIAVVTVRVVNHGVTNVSTDITLGSAATGTDSAPNAPNCNPGSSASRLWLSYFAADDDDNTTYWWPVEAAPVSQTKSTTGTSSCMVGVAQRWLEASSYNPSTFLMAASEEWRAQTFGIPPASTAAALVGAATGAGAATGGLTTGIPLAGAATGGASSTGDLTTGIPLAGAAAGAGAATGDLTTGIQAAGDATGSGAASGDLTTGIQLEGAAVGAGTAEGTVTSPGAALEGAATGGGSAAGEIDTGITLEGAAGGAAAASGDLTTGIQLAGDATGAATATGDLTTGGPAAALAGDAQGGAQSAGDLLTGIPLEGAATGSGVSTGSLAAEIGGGGELPNLIIGAATGAATATGDLTTGIHLDGDAVGAGTATGALSTSAPLAGAAVGGAIAAGALLRNTAAFEAIVPAQVFAVSVPVQAKSVSVKRQAWRRGVPPQTFNIPAQR